jgi:hypothetical protein
MGAGCVPSLEAFEKLVNDGRPMRPPWRLEPDGSLSPPPSEASVRWMRRAIIYDVHELLRDLEAREVRALAAGWAARGLIEENGS